MRIGYLERKGEGRIVVLLIDQTTAEIHYSSGGWLISREFDMSSDALIGEMLIGMCDYELDPVQEVHLWDILVREFELREVSNPN